MAMNENLIGKIFIRVHVLQYKYKQIVRPEHISTSIKEYRMIRLLKTRTNKIRRLQCKVCLQVCVAKQFSWLIQIIKSS
jgi:hypothetical protein